MDSVNWDAGKFLLELVQFLITVAVAIWAALRFGQQRNQSAISVLDEKQDTLELRILAVEKHLEHAPTHEDIQEIHRRIDDVAQEVKKIEGTLGQVNNSVTLIHQHLLEQKK